MDATEINTLAVSIAKILSDKFTKTELNEICTLLGQILCNIGTYLKCK